MRVLVAIDGSGHSLAAVDEIARRPLPEGSDIRIVSVVDTSYYPAVLPGEGPGNMALFLEIDAAAQIRARAVLDKAAAAITAAGVNRAANLTTQVLSGSAKRAILQEAEAIGADLIVVGSHGHGHFERFRLGSVSHAVAIHALCSVEIVRIPQGGK